MAGRKVHLTIATSDYDHFRDFKSGRIEAEGIDPTWMELDIHEIFTRFAAWREWHVSEMSFAKFSAQVTGENPDIIGLPVFASRVFRLSSIYVNPAKGIKTAADLKGKRIGVPEWAQTAAVYTRGWLQHDVGVPLTSIDWVQAGTEDVGRTEKVPLNLPNGLKLTQVNDKTLSDMLVSGEIDAFFSASIPKMFRAGNPNMKRLFACYREEEENYFKRSGVFPIMHIIAMRRDILDEYPWLARNLYLAFDESRRRSIGRMLEGSVSRYPIPWMLDIAEKMRDLFKGDFYPYGIEENRTTLEAFLTWSYEQGIAKKLVKPEDIFPPGINPSVKT